MIHACFYFLLLSLTCIFSLSAQQAETWKLIQKEAHNAVVKIISVKRDFHWFNPYIINNTSNHSGSGFFINNDGEILTNSHVVDNAISVYIMMPSLGKHYFNVDVVSICPQRDVALLRLTEESLAIIKKEFEIIPYLELGDSHQVNKFDEVLTLGFPLDSESLKSTAGIISGYSSVNYGNYSIYGIQIDAPINPGNSGGPLVDKNGLVIGINSASTYNAQNYNYAIPINQIKTIFSDLYTQPLLRLNSLEVVWSYATDQMRAYFGNPLSCGCLICEVDKDGNAARAGIEKNDMLYKVDGHTVDSYGDIVSPYNDEKICFSDYMRLLPSDQPVHILLYRNGTAVECIVNINDTNHSSIPLKYPIYETIDYEVFGGMIVMELTVNYIQRSDKNKPGLQRYLTRMYGHNSRLVIANILANSYVGQMRTVSWGDTINEVNGEKVKTLDDFRKALLENKETDIIELRTTNEYHLSSDNILTVLSLKESCKETVELSYIHNYPLSETVQELVSYVNSASSKA